MSVEETQVAEKTLLLDLEKLEKLRKLFKTDNDSKAVQQAIDETLAYNEALAAARRIQKRGTFGQN
jgi:hypothetical protein